VTEKIPGSTLASTRTTNHEPDVAGFHTVYWTITGAAIAAFFISLIIKQHSMDKLLESNFVLHGARNPVVNGKASASASTNPNPSKGGGSIAHGGLQEKGSASCSRMPSTFDTDTTSTFSAAKQSEYSRPENRESSLDGIDSEGFAEELAAVAYYIEPGGKLVPVDILSVCASTSSSQAASIHEVENEKPDDGPSDTPAAGRPEAVQVVADECRDDASPEVLCERVCASRQVRPDAAEHEAMFADLAPAWMHRT
jgi:hypothetical protein